MENKAQLDAVKCLANRDVLITMADILLKFRQTESGWYVAEHNAVQPEWNNNETGS